MNSEQQFDEIQVFEGVAERTGTRVGRETVRRSRSLCSSVSDLTRKARRMGDGYFYLSSLLWPEDTNRLDLTRPWDTTR